MEICDRQIRDSKDAINGLQATMADKLKPERFYDMIEVAVKHSTRIAGIRAEPYHTYHQEKRLNATKYNEMVNKCKRTLENLNVNLKDYTTKNDPTTFIS